MRRGPWSRAGWCCAADHPALARATDAGAELDDGTLIMTRSVAADGRSRAHLGGRSVPVGVLGELSEQLVAVHGQSDQQRLLKPSAQRDALDRYAAEPVLGLRERFRAAHARWRDVRATLAELRAAADERARDAELLRLGLAEVEAVAPAAGRGRRRCGRRSPGSTPPTTCALPPPRRRRP